MIEGTTSELGSAAFTVAVTDASGQRSLRSFTLAVLATPDTRITAPTMGITVRERQALITFVAVPAEDASFRCSVNGATAVSCTSPWRARLREGLNIVTVTASNGAGPDPTPAAVSITLDTVAPDTSITSGPVAFGSETTVRSSGSSAAFTLASSEPGATFECRLNGGAWLPCNASHTIDNLTPWTYYRLDVRARDLAGNVDWSPATYYWYSVAPYSVSIVVPTSVGGGSNAVRFEFTIGRPYLGEWPLCRFWKDGTPLPAWSRCPSVFTGGGRWVARYEQLSEGWWTFEVSLTNAAGTTVAQRRYVADDTPPTIAVTQPVPFARILQGSVATLVATCSDNLDPKPTCNFPAQLSTQRRGLHVLPLRARDHAGNSAVATVTYFVV